ncbi:NAD(P)-dependent dehydrogenase (short-subunit alcohol dehydrogenase family) [Paraburkholderia silvatlantica]|uniref:NAD(P)-dependent dehydrogenase (Short-subunit alcohol dehydrogenase family) n=1 Tax=Paraburkholderia silvatlantica TaxID=321895 RepID=A0A2V4U6Z7_9BURK|nr:SDR family oxidoreductase [Paraburkholderia silvatlantica]PYE18400.1 NAD(P)-dependent dehydrogenase (short-subunit alcohol dehydrogenase family) [Paraburkholderia silvatlantica]
MTYPFSIHSDEFTGKRVLVTGGTKGMGAAMVERFRISGARIATTARSEPDDVQEGVLFIKADISTSAGTSAIADRIDREWGGLDILVNNVGGTSTKRGDFEALTDEDWQTILDVNLLGAVRLDRVFLPDMMARNAGAIIHIGSVSHLLPFANSTLAYAASKAALRTYSKGLSKVAAPHGVRVNMISPGFIETTGAQGMIQDVARNQAIPEDAARKLIMDMLGGVPIGRTGMPEEVAELAAFLASERAGFVCGVDYVLDGGTIQTV